MEMKSISGIVCYVKDTEKTAEFYEALGFHTTERKTNHVSVRLNWFWMDFLAAGQEEKEEFQAEASAEPKGAGQYLYIKVANVDEFHKGLVGKGLQPSSEPRDWPWGNREFVIRDPDGYKLVFFQNN